MPRGLLFGLIDLSQPYAMYCLVLAVFLAGIAVIYRAIHSPFGQVLTAIPETRRARSRSDIRSIAICCSTSSLGGVVRLGGRDQGAGFELATLTDVTW